MMKLMLKFFQNPSFIWILIAVLIPIIIEWLLRRRRRLIRFAAMRYLLDTERPKKIRMQDRILLILRMLIIFLIIIALARPLIRPEDIITVDRKDRSVLLLFDATYSNAQRLGNSSAFSLAQRMANDVIDGLPEGVPVAICAVGHTAKVVQDWTADKGLLREKIDSLTVSHGAGAIADGLAWIAEEVKKKSKEKGRLTSEVFIFSDLQIQTWTKGEGEREAGKSTRALLPAITENAQVFIGKTGGERLPNVYIANFVPEDKILAAGITTEFLTDIRVTNLKESDTIPVRLSLYINDEKRYFTNFVVSASGRIEKVPYKVLVSGEQIVKVVIDGDNSPLDNERMYLAMVPPAMRVLIIDQNASAQPYERPTVFWEYAIAPPSAPGRERVSPFIVKVCTWEEAQKENFEDYASVVLGNVPEMPPGLAPRLLFYVKEGGNLLTFAGEGITPYSYEQLYQDGKGLLPASIRDKVDITGIIKPLITGAGTLEEASVRFLRQLGVLGQGAVQVKTVAQLDKGQPVIMMREYGNGRSIIVGLDPSLTWSTLPLSIDFPVFVQELLRLVMGDPNRLVNLKVGEPFSQPVMITAQHILLKGPGNRKVRLTPEVVKGEDLPRLTYADTDVQGIYELDAPQGVLQRTRFAVNLDPLESDMTMWTETDFKRELSRKVIFLSPDENVTKRVSELYKLREFAGILLFVVFLLLLVESFLAMRFGLRKG